MSKIKIKQVRSRIGRPKDQKRTLDALGLRKMHQVVEHNLTPQIAKVILSDLEKGIKPEKPKKRTGRFKR